MYIVVPPSCLKLVPIEFSWLSADYFKWHRPNQTMRVTHDVRRPFMLLKKILLFYGFLGKKTRVQFLSLLNLVLWHYFKKAAIETNEIRYFSPAAKCEFLG